MRTHDLFAGVLPFYYTAEERSFRRAAQRLGVTAAAVSKSILKLEENLGVKLLARTSRSVAPTPEGLAFLARCRDAINSVQAGREQLSDSRRVPRGEIHLTLPFILGRTVVAALPAFTARHADASLRLTMTDRLIDLVDRNVDVALRIGLLEDSSLVSRRLRDTRWSTVAAPSYLARRGYPLHPRDLAEHDCMQFVAPNGRRREWVFLEDGQWISPPIRPRIATDQGELLLEAALAGIGICQAFDFMAGAHVAAGRLIEVLTPFAAPGPPIHALNVRERSKSANVRACVAFLADIFGDQ